MNYGMESRTSFKSMVAYSKVVVIIMNTSMGYILEIKAS
jgi:hypothetical protein